MFYTSIDLETSGLDPQRHGIVSIGAITTQADGRKVEQFYSLCNPFGPASKLEMDPQAMEINGLKPSEIANAPNMLVTLRDLMFHWTEFNPTLVFCNAPFDVAFLLAAIRREQRLAPLYEKYYRRVLDLYGLQFMHCGKVLSLSEMCKAWGVKNEKAHNALADARVTSQIFHKLLQEKAVA
jgi:DNA polymerase III epsilon subunit-like protein